MHRLRVSSLWSTLVPRLSLLAVAVAFVMCGADPRSRGGSVGLREERDIPLAGGCSRFDYQSIDSTTNRLFIAHLGADLVTVVDLQTERVIADIPGLQRPHGVLAVPELHAVYVSATGTDEVAVIDASSLAIVARIHVGHYPDGLAFDPVTKQVFVSDESGKTVSVINTSTNEDIIDIAMGGEVGNTQYDPVTQHVFSAVQTRDELAEIDPAMNAIVGQYPTTGCKGPHGFLVDPATHLGLVTGEDNNVMVVFDLNSKKIVAQETVGRDPDVLAFDAGLRRLYVSSESGVVTVFAVAEGTVTKLHEGFLAKAAHSVAVDQRTHRVYFPLEDLNGRPVLRIMSPAD